MADISALTFNILLWVLVGICLFFVIARLAVRTWKRMWIFWLSEAWLILAALYFTSLVIGTTYLWVKGLHTIGDTQDIGFIQWQWATVFICEIGYYFPRFSLLAFYNELFPISEERLRKLLYGITAFNIVSFLIAVFSTLFWCGLPISKNWMIEDEHDCSLILTNKVFMVTWPFNIVSEILVFILPFGMLQTLRKTPLREKIALGCLFGIGIMSISMTVVRFVFAMESIFSNTTVLVGSAEIVSQIVVCAAPALRPLLPVIVTRCTRLTSIVTGKTTSTEDERALRGSYSTTGKQKGVIQHTEDNLPELATWHPSGNYGADLELNLARKL